MGAAPQQSDEEGVPGGSKVYNVKKPSLLRNSFYKDQAGHLNLVKLTGITKPARLYSNGIKHEMDFKLQNLTSSAATAIYLLI